MMSSRFPMKVMALSILLASAGHAVADDSMPASPVASGSELMSEASTPTTSKPEMSTAANGNNDAVTQLVKASGTPIVPANVLHDGVPSAKPLAKEKKVKTMKRIKAPAEKQNVPDYKTTPEVIVAKFGENKLVNVAVGQPNRIVTPFPNPSVLKMDKNAVVSIRQNVIYFATDRQYPVTLHIREKGSEQEDVSLTLMPQKIPPREVDIKIPQLKQDGIQNTYVDKKAKAWETDQPYQETLVKLMRAIAKGDIPQGYRIRKFGNSDLAPLCDQKGLKFRFKKGQVITGNFLQAFVGVAKNVSNKGIEFVETNCASDKVAAVSSWPHTYLRPGQETEVYVVNKIRQEQRELKRRPSLLPGGDE